MNRVTTGLVVLCLGLGAVAGWLWVDRLRAGDRADLLADQLEAAEVVRVAERDSLNAVIALRDLARDTAIEEAGTAIHAADNLAEEREAMQDSVHAVLASLEAGQRSILDRERANFQAELDSLRRANTRLQRALDIELDTRSDLEQQLARAEANLAAAIQTAEAEARARRPGPFARITGVLAVVGSAVLLDRGVCAVAQTQLILPCGGPS